jgi:hypothetical protein
MKRILIATLITLAAAPALAVTPSFNDHPEQCSGQVAGVMGKAAAEVGRTVAQPLPSAPNW